MIKPGFWIVSVSDAPILLYVMLEPGGDHPFGLGLLAVLGTLIGGGLVALGILLSRLRRSALRQHRARIALRKKRAQSFNTATRPASAAR